MKAILAAAVALVLTVQTPAARPRILGIAHLAVFVSDLPAARGFYRDLLGFDESFTLPKPDGSVDAAFIKINDRQWIELINRPTVGEGQLDHVALSTDGAERMRAYLASRGVQVPDTVGVGPTGDKSFTVTDPDGHRVEIVEYQGRGSICPRPASANAPCTSASWSASSPARRSSTRASLASRSSGGAAPRSLRR
jgi:lactoylglutathione lyase